MLDSLPYEVLQSTLTIFSKNLLSCERAQGLLPDIAILEQILALNSNLRSLIHLFLEPKIKKPAIAEKQRKMPVTSLQPPMCKMQQENSFLKGIPHHCSLYHVSPTDGSCPCAMQHQAACRGRCPAPSASMQTSSLCKI